MLLKSSINISAAQLPFLSSWRTLSRLASLTVALLLMPPALQGHAQTSPASDPPNPQPGTQPGPQTTLHASARLVVLDVVVVDSAGHPVTNLDRSQFFVTEDKIPQTIRNFDPPSGHRMPAGSGAAPLVNSSQDLPKIGNAPVNILVFDEVNTPFLQLAYARQMMERYLRALPEVLPVPTLFVAAGSTKMAVLHDYTQSRADLLESVRKHTEDVDFTAMLSNLNGGSGGADRGLAKTLGALSQIAESVRGVPGRKNVIWVGTGYRNALDLNNLSNADHDKTVAAIQRVTDRMLTARVTLNVIDPEGVAATDSGLASQLDPSAAGSAGGSLGTYGDNMAFESFATATGGRVILGRNDLGAQVAEVSMEGTEYYTLAYVPSNASDDAEPYRRIRVTLKDPSLRAITREGYFATEQPVEIVAPNKAKQPEQLRYDLQSAARSTLAYTGLHLEATRNKSGYTLLVNAGDLQYAQQPDGSRLAEVTVLEVCYSARGKELGQHAAELKERLEASERIEPGARVAFSFPYQPPMGTTHIRFVMRDAATGTIGSQNVTP